MTKNSDGGPTSYYDFKNKYKTVNDILEDKGPEQWKEHSWHLSNIFKAVWRWGAKDGTTMEYDAKKIIYSGCRVLRVMIGTEKLREYLNELLDDQQFQVDEVEGLNGYVNEAITYDDNYFKPLKDAVYSKPKHEVIGSRYRGVKIVGFDEGIITFQDGIKVNLNVI